VSGYLAGFDATFYHAMFCAARLCYVMVSRPSVRLSICPLSIGDNGVPLSQNFEFF